MRRIYFLLPSVASAKGIIDELLLKRIEWRHIHVLARPHEPLEDLPQATLTQRTDLLPALARGTAAGGVTGALAGLVAMAFPPAGLTIAGGGGGGVYDTREHGVRRMGRDHDRGGDSQYAVAAV